MQASFEKMKKILAADALCCYPDHTKNYVIYTYAYELQLGTCIMQNGISIAFHSTQLNSAQKNYNTHKKELLSIVMTLMEYCSMLLGA